MRRAEDRFPGNVELVERLEAEDAGAVDRHADLRVLFEDDDVVPGGGQGARGGQSGGTGADDRDITHDARLRYLRPRTSHVPCTLIQNDSRINRTSSQNEPRST